MSKWDKDSIKALRSKYNLSQFLFSKIMGTRQQTISEWEVGIYLPQNAYCRVFDIVEVQLEDMWNKAKKNPTTFFNLIFNKYKIDLTDRQILRNRLGRTLQNEIQKN